MPIFVIVAVALAVACGAWIPLEPQGIEDALHAIFNEPGGALFGHALISIAIFSGLIAIAVKKRVLPLPQVKLLMPLALLEVMILASILFSEYRHISLGGTFEWLSYGGALILTVGTVGRGGGVRMTLTAISAAISFMAVHGILEWIGSAQAGDPSWRIFAHTMNPNVAAAFFAVGGVCGLGLMGSKERLYNLLAGVGVFVCLVALLLTGSRGGLIAFLGAGFFFAIWLILLNRKQGGFALVSLVALLVLSFGLTTAMQKRFAGNVAGSRLISGGESQAQSSGFRKLLYGGTIKLVAERPQGYGLGTYRYYSAKPGLTTQTLLAHNGYLQLAMEASPAALIAFLVFLALLAFQAFRGTSSQPPDLQMLKAAVAGAIGALLIHAAFDSDFQVFGLGVLFFILCGLAIQLSADSSAPEFLHPGMRNGLIAAGVVVPLGLLYYGLVDLRHGLFLGSVQKLSRTDVRPALDSLTSFAPLDSRVWYTRFRMLQALGADTAAQGDALRAAVRLGPTLPMLRSMAQFSQEHPDYGSPDFYLNRVLELDPHNLLALEMKLEFAFAKDPEEAKRVAERLVDVEKTTYFQVRSLPEIVPLETYKGRAFLASSLQGDAKADMLLPAVKGFEEYAKVTVPKVVQFANAGMSGPGGISVDEARTNLEFGQKLIADYSGVRSDEAGTSAAAAVEGALASLSQ